MGLLWKSKHTHGFAHCRREGEPIAQLGERLTLDSKVAGFDPHQGRGVVSWSKTLHPHCLVLVKHRKPSHND